MKIINDSASFNVWHRNKENVNQLKKALIKLSNDIASNNEILRNLGLEKESKKEAIKIA